MFIIFPVTRRPVTPNVLPQMPFEDSVTPNMLPQMPLDNPVTPNALPQMPFPTSFLPQMCYPKCNTMDLYVAIEYSLAAVQGKVEKIVQYFFF